MLKAPCFSTGCRNRSIEGGSGYCLIHKPTWTSGRRKRLPKSWQGLRLLILKRDRYLCYKCGRTATEVDHIVNNDNNEMRNLAAVCSQCHLKKTLKESDKAMKAMLAEKTSGDLVAEAKRRGLL